MVYIHIFSKIIIPFIIILLLDYVFKFEGLIKIL